MSRILTAIFAMLLAACSTEPVAAWQKDPVESKVGIHVIPNFGDDPTTYSPDISAPAVQAALQSVDWTNGFHQIVVVISPGVSMEVGGSLNPDHGLSAVYRNRPAKTEVVTKNAPGSIADLEAILLAFLKKDESWRQVQEFGFHDHRSNHSLKPNPLRRPV
jgi:hypothetical protein